jgi:membrane associated rhomboid family serine protease
MSFLFHTLILLLLNFLIFPVPVRDGDDLRYKTTPYAVYALIAINTLVFLIWIAPDLIHSYYHFRGFNAYGRISDYRITIDTYGFRSVYLKQGLSIGAFTTFTSMFMHIDFNHLIGNMVFLAAFGRRVEDACGHWRFLLFYIIAGIISTLGFALIIPDPGLPAIGASGAIFGVMGAYFILYRNRRVQCVWLFAIGVRFIMAILSRLFGKYRSRMEWSLELPALLVIFIYAGFNFGATVGAINAHELTDGVNYVAHIAGFASALLIFLFVRKDLLMRYYDRRPL